MFQKSLAVRFACAIFTMVVWTSTSDAQFSAGIATAPVNPVVQNNAVPQQVVVPPVNRPVQVPAYTYGAGTYVPTVPYVSNYPVYGYGYGYSAPYRSNAYPYGTSYLGPTVYPGLVYPRVRVRTTPTRSRTFGGAHSSQYFGNPHASQYLGN